MSEALADLDSLYALAASGEWTARRLEANGALAPGGGKWLYGGNLEYLGWLASEPAAELIVALHNLYPKLRALVEAVDVMHGEIASESGDRWSTQDVYDYARPAFDALVALEDPS